MDETMKGKASQKYRRTHADIQVKISTLIFLTMILPTMGWIILLDKFGSRDVLSLMAILLVFALALLSPLSRLATWLIVTRELRSINNFCFEVQRGANIKYFGLLSGVSTDNEMQILKKNLNFLGRLHSLRNELKNTETALDLFEKLAVTDQLTGLYNRRFFDEQLKNCASNNESNIQNLYLLMIDADKFKYVNDNLGHQEGDRLLQNLGRIIKNSIREKSDYPCRIGGDEFCVIFSDLCLTQVQIVADRIRTKFERIAVGGVTLSMGISKFKCSCDPEKDLCELINLADQAVYAAKRHGGNRIELNCS
jgi:diguanylate cyclase (GGDEF)-like protein